MWLIFVNSFVIKVLTDLMCLILGNWIFVDVLSKLICQIFVHRYLIEFLTNFICLILVIPFIIDVLTILMNVPKFNQQDATLHSLFISVNCSTCFGWIPRPLSGAQNCIYSIWYLSKHYCSLPLNSSNRRRVSTLPR